MSDPVSEFAKHLAGLDDEKRAGALARAKLMGMQQAPQEAFEPPIRSLEEYLAADIEMPPVLIHPTAVVRGGINVVVGRAGKGKTVMALNRILRWGAGLGQFEGWSDSEGNPYFAPDEPLRILIVENEGSAGMFHHQIGVMCSTSEHLTDEQRKLTRENVMIWGEGGWSNMKLDDPNKLTQLRVGVEKHKPDIVYIEPFRSLWKGEENSSTEMNVVVDAMIGIATDYDCGVIFAHHERKSGSGEDGEKMSAARGSGVLEGAVTLMENFESAKSGEQRELSWSKVRYQDPHRQFPAPVRMEWQSDSWWYKWVPMSALEDSVIQVIRDAGDEPPTATDIADELGEKVTKVRPILQQLVKENRLKKFNDGNGPGVRFRMPSGSATSPSAPSANGDGAGLSL